MHRPYIEQTDLFVHASGEEEGVELRCLVHALPPAQVSWYRGDTLLPSPQYNITHPNTNIYKLSLPPEEALLGKLSLKNELFKGFISQSYCKFNYGPGRILTVHLKKRKKKNSTSWPRGPVSFLK